MFLVSTPNTPRPAVEAPVYPQHGVNDHNTGQTATRAPGTNYQRHPFVCGSTQTATPPHNICSHVSRGGRGRGRGRGGGGGMRDGLTGEGRPAGVRG